MSTEISSTHPLGPTSPYLRPFVICSVALTNSSFPRADIENPSTCKTHGHHIQHACGISMHHTTIRYKKCSYHRGTVQHAMLLNLCYASWATGVTKVFNFQTTKVAFKVIQGHWQWCHLIGHIQFPINLTLQQCLYLAPLTRYYHLFS